MLGVAVVKIVLVTGSRSWPDVASVAEVLRGADVLLIGDCPTGADAIALEHGHAAGCMVLVFSASSKTAARVSGIYPGVAVVEVSEWERDRKLAGPLRNKAMAKRASQYAQDGIVPECHAFPTDDSVGTWDCVRALKELGLEATVHEP